MIKKIEHIFFKTTTKNSDVYYPNTNIYKLNELERAYYNLGLICFYFRQYNYASDNFKSYLKLIKDKSAEHRNRVYELLMIIKFLLIYNTKKEFDIGVEIKKLPKYNIEQEIKLEFLIIKMYENNFEDTSNKAFLNPLKINIYNFVNAYKNQNPSHVNLLSCFDYSIPIFYELFILLILVITITFYIKK